MVRVGARLLSVLLLASWFAPAALGDYSAPHACCRRAGHHCPQSTERSFRDAKLHCGSCQSLVTAHQAPRLSPVSIGITVRDEHPFVHEFSSEFSSSPAPRSQSQRAPPPER